LKILHITTDNKFISAALNTFESVYPNQNTVWMLNSGQNVDLSNKKYDKLFSFKQTFLPSFLKEVGSFDLVILHSLILQWYPLISLAPIGTKFAWLGWGYDYYNYIYVDSQKLLLEDTVKVEQHLKDINKSRLTIKSIVKYPAKIAFNVVIKKVALKRITSFSPVIKEDYELVKSAKKIPFLPTFMPWNYGSLEEDLIKNFIGKRADGHSILVGNSATPTNNHIEVFNFLSNFNLNKSVKVITPLSYGDESYKKKVIEFGNERLEHSFEPIIDFIPIHEYIYLIKECGYVIMNHKRQQGVGNIVIMLYLGARVFLREENPTYKMLKKEGAILNTVQELESNSELLKRRLSENEIKKNIEVLYKHWSKVAIDRKTKDLVEFHLGSST